MHTNFERMSSVSNKGKAKASNRSVWVVDFPDANEQALNSYHLQQLLDSILKNRQDVDMDGCRFTCPLPSRAGFRSVISLKGENEVLDCTNTMVTACQVPSWQIGVCIPAIREFSADSIAKATTATAKGGKDMELTSDFFDCAYCHKQASSGLQTCSGCYAEAFCDRDCQKNGWPVHKPKCLLRQREISEWGITKEDLMGETIIKYVGRNASILNEQLAEKKRNASAST